MQNALRLFENRENSNVAKKTNWWFFPLLFGIAFIERAICATPPIPLRISAETAPAGGWAQIRIYAAKAMAIAKGHLVLNLDATAFGTGAMVGLFGANGDAEGLATVNGSHREPLGRNLTEEVSGRFTLNPPRLYCFPLRLLSRWLLRQDSSSSGRSLPC
jgi:hypothetical protein